MKCIINYEIASQSVGDDLENYLINNFSANKDGNVLIVNFEKNPLQKMWDMLNAIKKLHIIFYYFKIYEIKEENDMLKFVHGAKE
jgi:hypothetical protein